MVYVNACMELGGMGCFHLKKNTVIKKEYDRVLVEKHAKLRFPPFLWLLIK